jgi:hypothetical protein
MAGRRACPPLRAGPVRQGTNKGLAVTPQGLFVAPVECVCLASLGTSPHFSQTRSVSEGTRCDCLTYVSRLVWHNVENHPRSVRNAG